MYSHKNLRLTVFAIACAFTVAKYYSENTARMRLGGDIEISSERPALEGTLAFLGFNGTRRTQMVTAPVELSAGSRETQAVITSIDRYYPLYGARDAAFKKLFKKRRKGLGALVNQALLDVLEIKVGGVFIVGTTRYKVLDVLASGTDPQPRLWVNKPGMRPILRKELYDGKTTYSYRAILTPPYDLDALKTDFARKFDTELWVYRDWRDLQFAPFRWLSWPLVAFLNVLAIGYALTGFIGKRRG